MAGNLIYSPVCGQFWRPRWVSNDGCVVKESCHNCSINVAAQIAPAALLEKRMRFFSPKAVSDLCDKYHIHPTLFYQWQRQLFENGTAAFEGK